MCLALSLAAAMPAAAQEAAPARPRITGVAHAAFFTKDLDNTRRFFKELMG